MLEKFKKDPNTSHINFTLVKKFVVLTGTNNIDGIVNDSTGFSFHKTMGEITALLSHLHSMAPEAIMNIVNVLPRNNYERNVAISQLNNFLYNLSCQYREINFINTELNRCLFSTVDGFRRNFYFKPSYGKISDNVHLNKNGIARLAKHLKYIAHNPNI